MSIDLNDYRGPMAHWLGFVKSAMCFATSEKLSIEMSFPKITIDGVGRLAYPLCIEQAKTLLSALTPVQHDIDTATTSTASSTAAAVAAATNVKSWQLEPQQVTIDPHWLKQLQQEVVPAACTALGLDAAALGVEARFYKLLYYEEGGQFKKHKDTEKESGMFGSLIMQLPAEYEGAALVVQHVQYQQQQQQQQQQPQQQQHRFDWALQSADAAFYAAFYSDCDHYLEPVTKGHRLALEFHLIRTKQLDIPLTAPTSDTVTAAVASCEEEWVKLSSSKDEELIHRSQKKLACKLEHRYSVNFQFSDLRGSDKLLVEFIRSMQDASANPIGDITERPLFQVCIGLHYGCNNNNNNNSNSNSRSYRNEYSRDSDSDGDNSGSDDGSEVDEQALSFKYYDDQYHNEYYNQYAEIDQPVVALNDFESEDEDCNGSPPINITTAATSSTAASTSVAAAVGDDESDDLVSIDGDVVDLGDDDDDDDDDGTEAPSERLDGFNGDDDMNSNTGDCETNRLDAVAPIADDDDDDDDVAIDDSSRDNYHNHNSIASSADDHSDIYYCTSSSDDGNGSVDELAADLLQLSMDYWICPEGEVHYPSMMIDTKQELLYSSRSTAAATTATTTAAATTTATTAATTRSINRGMDEEETAASEEELCEAFLVFWPTRFDFDLKFAHNFSAAISVTEKLPLDDPNRSKQLMNLLNRACKDPSCARKGNDVDRLLALAQDEEQFKKVVAISTDNEMITRKGVKYILLGLNTYGWTAIEESVVNLLSAAGPNALETDFSVPLDLIYQLKQQLGVTRNINSSNSKATTALQQAAIDSYNNMTEYFTDTVMEHFGSVNCSRRYRSRRVATADLVRLIRFLSDHPHLSNMRNYFIKLTTTTVQFPITTIEDILRHHESLLLSESIKKKQQQQQQQQQSFSPSASALTGSLSTSSTSAATVAATAVATAAATEFKTDSSVFASLRELLVAEWDRNKPSHRKVRRFCSLLTAFLHSNDAAAAVDCTMKCITGHKYSRNASCYYKSILQNQQLVTLLRSTATATAVATQQPQQEQQQQLHSHAVAAVDVLYSALIQRVEHLRHCTSSSSSSSTTTAATATSSETSWCIARAYFPQCPDLQEFLRGPQRDWTKHGFNGIGEARAWAQQHLRNDRYGVQFLEIGVGKKARVELHKTEKEQQRSLRLLQTQQEEMQLLQEFLSVAQQQQPQQQQQQPQQQQPQQQQPQQQQQLPECLLHHRPAEFRARKRPRLCLQKTAATDCNVIDLTGSDD